MTVTFYDRRGVARTPGEQSVIKPRTGAWILARAEDSVLFVWPECARSIPDLPGGGVEDGETLQGAACREWNEETGLSFEPQTAVLNQYHHVRGFYAEDCDEYWIYDQTFFLFGYERKRDLGRRWRNPEGDEVSWESLKDLQSIPVNCAHWLAFEVLVPEALK